MVKPKKNIYMASDRAIKTVERDSLNRDKFATMIKDIAVSNININTLGVFGYWGSGKSSVLEMVKEMIGDDWPVVWFDAWKYDKQNDLLTPLLRTIETNVSGEDSEGSESLKKLKRIGYVTLKGITQIVLNAATAGALDVESLEDYANKYNQLCERAIDVISESENHFNKYVESVLTAKDKKKLIIIVDDLDRCLPENCISFLENIKLYLSANNCIFIFAVDQRVISTGIKQKYPNISDEDCNEYIDKIINIHFDIPELTMGDIHSYINSLVYEFDEDDKKYMTEMLLKSNLDNPRKIKRAINKLDVFTWMQEKEIIKSDLTTPHVFRILLLFEFYPNEMNKLVSNQTLYEQIISLLSKAIVTIETPLVIEARRIISKKNFMALLGAAGTASYTYQKLKKVVNTCRFVGLNRE